MSPYSYFSLSSKRSKVICAQNDKKRVFCDSDVLKNVLKFQIFFCPENKNIVCPGLGICWTIGVVKFNTRFVVLNGRL